MKIMMTLMLLFLINGCYTGQKKNVEFIVNTSKKLAGTAMVYISGNCDELGNWEPKGLALKKVDDKVWTGEISVPKGTRLEYKITRGSWDSEATDAEGYTMQNQYLNVNADTSVNYYVVNWKDEKHQFRGKITGKLIYYRDMKGDGILPRDVIVWLPPSYVDSTSKRYPVLYMHDGQNIIDPRTSYTGIDWQVDENVTQLSKEGKMQEVIVVGINNSATRTADYSDTDRGRAYMDFIINKVKPLIDKTYRTKADREHTATMGSSMGGLISFMMVWFHPEVFSEAACLSPAFSSPFDYSLDWVEDANKIPDNIKIYIDCGDITLDERLLPEAEEMVRLLKKKGMVVGKNLMWFLDHNAEHNEAAWANRVWRPLEFMFPGNNTKEVQK